MNDEEIRVSVLCTAFNHEKFIRQALESFVSQKTNFRYEVIVHDDSSTDNTIEIIKEFEKKYPEIIKPIYETENQYSKGKHIINTYMLPVAMGKYIAICEGDDYWCDEYKLQKQFDYMEGHPECSMCVHNTIIHDLQGKKKDNLFNSGESRELTINEVFFDWKVHTSSFFIRKQFAKLPEQYTRYWFEDFVRLTLGFNYGKIYYLKDTMSVYNKNNKEGVTYIISHDKEKIISKNNEIIDFLIKYNKFTDNKYSEIVDLKINEIKIKLLLAIEVDNYEEYKRFKKEFKENKYRSRLMQDRKERITSMIKTSNYLNYKIYFYLKKKIKK